MTRNVSESADVVGSKSAKSSPSNEPTSSIDRVPYVSDLVLNATVDAGNPTIGAQLQGDLSALKNAFAVIPGFVFSWDRANIRLGVGYSDFFVEGFYVVVPGTAAHPRRGSMPT